MAGAALWGSFQPELWVCGFSAPLDYPASPRREEAETELLRFWRINKEIHHRITLETVSAPWQTLFNAEF